MNIFLIPSWYPSEDEPISGIFTKEQTLYISRANKNMSFHVSIGGRFILTPRNIYKSIKNLLISFMNGIKIIKIADNYTEYILPSLSWNRKFQEGNLQNELKYHRKNFKNIESKFAKLDIIHAHVSYPAGYIAYRLSKEFNVPYIITEHMSPFPFKSYLADKNIINKIKLSIQNADKTIAVSNSLKQDICKFTSAKYEIIPNFIDEEQFVLDDTVEHNDKYIKFLTVGSLNSQKGIDILLKAISIIKNKIKNAKFTIVGDGKNKSKYKSMAQTLEITNFVIFKGRLSRTETLQEFKKCDIFVLSSRHESFGVVYIEALACGKPIIATKCGGPEDIVNNFNGFIVENENINQLANAIYYMYSNYDIYSSKEIRRDFQKRFSKQVNTTKYIELYKDTVRKYNVRN